MSQVVEVMHEQYAKGRRASVLGREFNALIPEGASVLDVGTGDGTIAASVLSHRGDVELSGLEYQVRDDCAIPVQAFDGVTIPCEDGSYDYVSFLDVLHHTIDPLILLKEAVRVARKGLIIKDHLRQGFMAGSTLRFMDKVGNRRYGIELPNTYWSPAQWKGAFESLQIESVEWHGDLGIYPPFADWIFGRGLHFFARLEKTNPSDVMEIEYWHEGLHCCNERWEAAYRRFETPEEEYAKFKKRFLEMGIDKLPKDSAIADIFCGTGNGLRVLGEWGFTNLTGVDLSPHLIGQAPVNARRVVADCTDLKFPDQSVDYFIVQGGLHHLPRIPEDLDLCLKEVARSLRPGGKFFVVEPWNTPFLQAVHAITRNPVSRYIVPRFDAFATMVEEELETYQQWLSKGELIQEAFERHFRCLSFVCGWGKCQVVAEKK